MREYWSIEDIQALEPLEHDYQEFKASAFLIREDDTISSEFIYKFSKQISAFSNAQGGRIFLGIRDDGSIDDGIPKKLKPGGTKPWLENLIQDIVNPRLQQYNVFEVSVSETRAVYIIDVPASVQAPHQAKDQRYYIRVSGMSRPMGHLHIEDVFRRNRNPRMKLQRVAPYQTPLVVHSKNGVEVLQAFRLHLSNIGNSMAKHVGGEVSIPRTLITKAARQKTLAEQKIHYTQKPSEMAFFHYLGIPLFPSQEVYFMIFWVAVTQQNVEHIQHGQFIRTRIYADDAEPKEEIIDLSSIAQFRDIALMDIWKKDSS